MGFFLYILVCWGISVCVVHLTKTPILGPFTIAITLALGFYFLLGVKVLTIALILGLYIGFVLVYHARVRQQRREADPTPGNADEYEKLIEKHKREDKENK